MGNGFACADRSWTTRSKPWSDSFRQKAGLPGNRFPGSPTSSLSSLRSSSSEQVILGDEGGEEAGDEAHDRDECIQRRTGRILEGVADGVANDGRLVRFRSRTAAVARFDILLGVVPETARVGHEKGEYDAREDSAAEEAAQGCRPEDESHDEGQDDGEQGREHEGAKGPRGSDADASGIVGEFGAR